MEQEQGLEPVQDAEEVRGEAPIARGRSEGLFGESREPPSLYRCAQCNKNVLAQDVAWDRENQPRCFDCHSILERQSD